MTDYLTLLRRPILCLFCVGVLLFGRTAFAELFSVVDLGQLPNGSQARSFSIDDAGHIVGESTTTSGTRAFLYNGTSIGDLTTELGINQSGQITAYGRYSGETQTHSFLLNPASVPEPGSFALAILAILAASRLRKRRAPKLDGAGV